jgi:hypothetical protein
MRHEWLVEVRNHEGAPVADAVVALQPEIFPQALGMTYPFYDLPGTHQHVGDGRYASFTQQLSDGLWYLVVQHPASSQVVQPLQLRQTAEGEFRAALPRGRVAATVSFSVEKVATAEGPARHTVLRVTLFPASEVVLMTGTEYESKGTQFLHFALGRREALFREGKIDAGTLVTVLSCDNRCRATFVKAQRGWFDVEPLRAPPDGVRAGRMHAKRDDKDNLKHGRELTAAGALSIVHLYKHLDAVGQRKPGTVKEVSLFSHSYQDGPLFYNTYQDPSFAELPDRDPNDLDGRMKDFDPVNVDGVLPHQGWAAMKDAMASDGRWQLWGCSADGRTRAYQSDAQGMKGKGDDTLFVSHYAYPGYLIYEERMTRNVAIKRADKIFRTDSYAARVAAHFDCPVFAAPAGVGAEFAFEKGISFMRCVASDYGKLYAFIKDAFGDAAKPTEEPFNSGYVDYHAVQQLPEPAEIEVRPEFYIFMRVPKDGPRGKSVIVFPGGLRFVEEGSDFALRSRDMTLDGKSGVRYLLNAPGEPRDRAFFATTDEVFVVNRDGSGEFTELEAI